MNATGTKSLEATINELRNIRDSAANDLATMPAFKRCTRWATARVHALVWANDQLREINEVMGF